MSSSLDYLKATETTAVRNSGDFEVIGIYKPQYATINPSLILAASNKPAYARLVKEAVAYANSIGDSVEDQVDASLDHLLVGFGNEILKVIPGKVSTEIDARFSFDKESISKDRVLIKIASTWEGIQAARVLQSEHGINCNLALTFSMTQAIASAEAGAYVISPFVGRISDWYNVATKTDCITQDDPSIKSVDAIFDYYKKFDYKTIVMGASFGNVHQVAELAGCGYHTISPELLWELFKTKHAVSRSLDTAYAQQKPTVKKTYIDDEPNFRFDINEEAMAVEKLREGISKFAADATALKDILRKCLSA